MESQATPMRNNGSPASHPFWFYFNLHVVPKYPLIKNPMAQQHVYGYCNNLVDLLEALYKIDKSITVWPFTEPMASKSELLTNPLSLGHTITQLTKYFSGLKIKNDFSPFMSPSFWVFQWLSKTLWKMFV